MSKLENPTDILALLHNAGCVIERCGSRVTCDPAPTDTDQDWLVVVPNNSADISSAVENLSMSGFQWEGGEHYQSAAGNFMSWRKADVNLIVTANTDFAEKHRAATHICKRLNLLNKPDRIAVFQAVLYAAKYEEKAEASA